MNPKEIISLRNVIKEVLQSNGGLFADDDETIFDGLSNDITIAVIEELESGTL